MFEHLIKIKTLQAISVAEDEAVLQDSVVGGDLHVGDVHNNIHTTNVSKSTNVELPKFENVGEGIVSITQTVFDFVKGIINRVLLFATVTVLVSGFLIYNGNIDVNELFN